MLTLELANGSHGTQVVVPHSLSKLLHLLEVGGDILLIINAEKTVSNVVVYFLLVLLDRR